MKSYVASVLMTGLLASTIAIAHAEQPTPYVQTQPTQAHTVENVQFATSPVSNGSVNHLVNDGTQATTVVTPNQGYVNTTVHQQTNTGYVQQQPQQQYQQAMPMLTGADYFQFSKQDVKLKTVSNRKFDGYELKLINTQPYHVQIMSGQITNALSEQQIAAEKQAKKKRGFGFGKMALGALSVAAHAGGMAGLHGGGGASAMLAAARAQQVAGVAQHALYNANMVSNNADGSMSITGAYVQQFKEVILGPNQEFRFQVIVPNGQEPTVQMVFKNLETNQILDVRQSI